MKSLKDLRFPIVLKLVSVTVLLLLSATIPIAIISYMDFEEAATSREDEGNITHARSTAARVEGLLANFLYKIQVVGDQLHRTYATPDEKQRALDLSFTRDYDFVAASIYELKGDKAVLVEREIKEDYLKNYGETRDYIDSVRSVRKFPILEAFVKDKPIIRNSSLPARKSESGEAIQQPPLLTIAIPLVKDELQRTTHVVLADLAVNRLQQIFATISEREIYLVDEKGQILAHPNEEWLTNAYSAADIPVVAAALRQSVRAKQEKAFTDPHDGRRIRGAFAKTAFDVTVIAQVDENVILEPARAVRRNVIMITGVVLSAAFFFVFLFSVTLTAPIERLVEMAREVARGNFDAKSDVNSKDEVGELAQAFDDMTIGLKERDKIKNVFNKFHGSSITEDLLQGDLSLGGSNKEVTVFFSDIRDFTKFSEGHSPEEVVNMLNEYFAIMVGIINKNHGVVDKFIGDAIMAVWGAPKSTGNDQYNAVKACLEMRIALNELNERRAVRGQTPIKIGIGIHSGRAISGTIGSSERMEYTVIGDTVNMTSRIESSTKAFGTDLLVSDVTAELVKEKFILEFAGSAEVKGKSEALKLFKVRGFIDEAGQPVIVKTPFSDYTAEGADKVKVVA